MTNWKHIAEQLAEGMQEIDREYEGYMSHMHFRVMAKQIAEKTLTLYHKAKEE